MTSAGGTKAFIERLGSSSILVLMALLAAAVFAEPRSESPNYLSPSTLVADPRGGKLYIAEHTANQVAVFDLSSGRVERVIALPGRPSGLAISTDGARLYVTAGGVAGKIHIVDTDRATVTDSIEVGHTPMAPVLSADGKTLYVTNRFDNDVSMIDLASKATLSRMRVVREPVAAVLSLDGKRLFVANQLPAGPADAETVAATVSVLDLEERRKIADIALPDGSTGLRAMATSPEGRYLYVTHILARYRLPTSQIERGWVHTNAVTIIDTEHLEALNTVLLDDTTLGAANPWGVAVSPGGDWLCIAHSGTHEVSVIDLPGLHRKLEQAAEGQRVSDVSTAATDVPNDLSFLAGLRKRVRLDGIGPRDLIIVGATAYTPEYFSDSLAVVDLEAEAGPRARSIQLGPERLLTMERRGEMIFHDAEHTLQKWLSCVSCHPDGGRPDGLNWDLILDGVGNAKNTKSLLLAHQTPPTTITGTRANAEVSVRSGFLHIEFSSVPETDAVAVDAYLKSLEPVPSPFLVNGRLGTAALRGREVFERTGCGGCHGGPLLTDMQRHVVGTGRGAEKETPYDTPTLVEIWRTAPYLHDGRARTLKDIFDSTGNGWSHSLANRLNESEIDDLAAYVRTL